MVLVNVLQKSEVNKWSLSDIIAAGIPCSRTIFAMKMCANVCGSKSVTVGI